MAFGELDIQNFTHNDSGFCDCVSCCLDGSISDIGAGDSNAGVWNNGRAWEILTELDLLSTIGDGRFAPPLAQDPDAQSATAGSYYVEPGSVPEDGSLYESIDALIRGYVWNTTSLTFSFPDSANDYEANYGGDDEELGSFSALNGQQEFAAYAALDQYSSVSGLNFVELGDDIGEDDGDADLRYAETGASNTAWGYYPSSNVAGGDTWYNTTKTDYPDVGDWSYHTFLHETGHAMGLKHGQDTSGAGALPYNYDSMEYSVMTYHSYVGHNANGYTNASDSYAQSLMMLDIAAVQRLYGANFNSNSGDTVYSFSTTTGEMFIDNTSVLDGSGLEMAGNKIFRTVWDGNGTDTYDFSNYTNDIKVDLTPGGVSNLDVGGTYQLANLGYGNYASGHLYNALQFNGDTRSLIENAIGGAGDDEFIGNQADNQFFGNDGGDLFHASIGNDEYDGGAGVDTVQFATDFDSFTFAVSGADLIVGGDGSDTIIDNIEWLDFSDQTWAYDDLFATLSGNSAPDAMDDSFGVTEDVVLNDRNVLNNDSDPEADQLSVSAVNGTAGNVGTTFALSSGALLTVNQDGSFDYDQNGAFDYLKVGDQAVDSFTYDASDGMSSDTATVNITIDGVFDNTPPDAVDDPYNIDEGVILSDNLLDNDVDFDGDQPIVAAVNGDSGNVDTTITLGSGALLTVNADGSFSYDQNGQFDHLETGQTGQDSFDYTIIDGQGGADTATATLTIAGYSPPVTSEDILINFETDAAGVYAGTDDLVFAGLTVNNTTALNGSKAGRLANSDEISITDVDGGDFDFDGATFRAVSGRVRVEIEAYDDGVLVGSDSFNSKSNRDSVREFGESFNSVDQIIIKSAGDVWLDDLSFTVFQTISVGGNNAPIALGDSTSTSESSLVSGNVLDNDSDPDGDAISVVSFADDIVFGGTATLASGATVSMQSDGQFDYDPNGAFDHLYNGESIVDSFSYVIEDRDGLSDAALVQITVDGEGGAPVATLIDFESTLPDSYGNLMQGDYVFADAMLTSRAKGVVSGSRALQSEGDVMTISRADGESFDFDSGYFTAGAGRVSVLVEGYQLNEEDEATLVASESFSVRDKRELFHQMDNSFDDIDFVTITANNGTIVDDLSFF